MEVVESIAEDAENMDQHSDHEDVRSEHSDQDHDNPPVEHDDGKLHVLFESSALINIMWSLFLLPIAGSLTYSLNDAFRSVLAVNELPES